MPGADFAGITLVGAQRRVENRGATDPLVAELDEVQANLGEGPCLDALWEHRTVVIDDMHTDDRWPRFAAAAADRGIGGSLSFQLFVEGDHLGALNLYGSCASGFDQESEDVGLIFATHAAVALVGAQHEATLRVAVSSRDLIGQAKGILMERYRLTADQAFTLLTRASMTTNRKVTDIAAELATTGQLPADR